MCVGKYVGYRIGTYLAFPRIDVENVLVRVAADFASVCVCVCSLSSVAGTPYTHTHEHTEQTLGNGAVRIHSYVGSRDPT